MPQRPAQQRFSATQRVKSTRDFARIYARRCAVSNTWLTLCGCENQVTIARLGVSVSRKVGNAVARNRWKRLLREAFRLTADKWPAGIDYVIIPRKTEHPDLSDLKGDLPKLAQQLAKRLSKTAATKDTNIESSKPARPTIRDKKK